MVVLGTTTHVFAYTGKFMGNRAERGRDRIERV
jgi:hypothetical protein